MRYGWQFFAFGSAFFAGLTALFGKIGVTAINSNLATFLRTVVILLLTGMIVTARKEWQWPDELPARSLIFLALSAVATAGSWLCYYRALQLGPASSVAPVDKLGVVFAIVLAVVVLGEPLTWRTLVGGGLVTAGALVLAFA